MSSGTRIAVSIAPRAAREISGLYSKAISSGADLVEIRLDYLPPGDLSTGIARGLDCGRLMFTYRSPEEGGLGRPLDESTAHLLEELWGGCPGSLLDIELGGARRLPELRRLALRARESAVISRHYTAPPPIEAALSDYSEMVSLGRYAKLVFPAKRPRDNMMPFSLYRAVGPRRLIGFCSGAPGILSRVMSAALGAPIAYASIRGRQVSRGQLPADELAALVEGIAASLGTHRQERLFMPGYPSGIHGGVTSREGPDGHTRNGDREIRARGISAEKHAGLGGMVGRGGRGRSSRGRPDRTRLRQDVLGQGMRWRALGEGRRCGHFAARHVWPGGFRRGDMEADGREQREEGLRGQRRQYRGKGHPDGALPEAPRGVYSTLPAGVPLN